MKRHIVFLIVLSHGVSCFAQQSPHYTQYIFNNYLLNPAVGGSKGYIDTKIGYRTQWIGFEAAPQTMFLSINAPLKNRKKLQTENHEGIGGYIIHDQTGPFSKMGAYLSYSYHVKITRKLKVSLGFSGGVLQYKIDGEAMMVPKPDDPAVQSVNTFTPDASAGLWLYSDNYFTGISVHQILPMKLIGTNNKLNNHYFVTAGYRIKTKRGSIIPSAHVKLAILYPVSVDINLKYDWMNKFWVGISYRKTDAIAGLVGFNIGNILEIGYAYDFTLSQLKNYSSNTHEIIIGIRPFIGPKAVPCPAFM
ncbi:MAG: type IX secretion system membrane protein PorP/SprF [Bacteroidota bacterium]